MMSGEKTKGFKLSSEEFKEFKITAAALQKHYNKLNVVSKAA